MKLHIAITRAERRKSAAMTWEKAAKESVAPRAVPRLGALNRWSCAHGEFTKVFVFDEPWIGLRVAACAQGG